MKSIQIQLTTKCNQRCFMCRKYKWKHKSIDIYKLLDFMKNVLSKNKRCTFTFSGGDPLEYECLEELTDFLIENNVIYQVFTNLNYVLDDVNLRFLCNAARVQVSFDGGCEDVYKFVRRPANKDFDYIDLQKKIVYLGGFTKVKLNCTVSNRNYFDLTRVIDFAHENELEVRFFPVHTDENAMLEQRHFDVIKTAFTFAKQRYGEEWGRLFTNINTFEYEPRKDYCGKCFVKNEHRIIDEDFMMYTCCRAINDNGEDVMGKYSLQNDEGIADTLADENVLYDYCKQCDRYRKFNENWEEYKDNKELFL